TRYSLAGRCDVAVMLCAPVILSAPAVILNLRRISSTFAAVQTVARVIARSRLRQAEAIRGGRARFAAPPPDCFGLNLAMTDQRTLLPPFSWQARRAPPTGTRKAPPFSAEGLRVLSTQAVFRDWPVV